MTQAKNNAKAKDARTSGEVAGPDALGSEESLLEARRRKAEAVRARGENPFANDVDSSTRVLLSELRSKAQSAQVTDAGDKADRYDAAKVEAALEQTDLAGMSDRMVDSLSGGERQRAWLAMMVAQDARCLLLDEPTSALDIAHQVEMLTLVRKLSREGGVGVVIVIHDINMAARFCDRIVALRQGEVVAEDAPAGILDAAVLKRIYGLEMGILPTAGLPVSYVP